MKTVNISIQKIRNKLRALSEEVSSFDSAWLVLYKIENWLTDIEEDKEDNNSHWKPSEEQMSMLLSILNEPNNASSESARLMLESLYNDLKAL